MAHDREADAELRGVAAIPPGWSLAIIAGQYAVLLVLLLFSLCHWPSWWPHAGLVIGGVLPVIVPWAGALGGTTHALYSLVYHWYKYRGGTLERRRARLEQAWTWNVFYLTRLVLGTVFGTLAVLIVAFVAKSIDIGQDGQIASAGKAVLFVVAFAVGFQQSNFKALLEKVTSLILAPSESDEKSADKDAETPPVRFTGSTLFGELKVGTSSAAPRPVFVENTTGKAVPEVEVKVAGTDTDAFTIDTTELLPIPAESATPVLVTFTPTHEGEHEATLTLIRKGKTIDSVELLGKGAEAEDEDA